MQLPGLAGTPQAHLVAASFGRHVLRFRCQPQVHKATDTVGADLESGADFAELRRLL